MDANTNFKIGDNVSFTISRKSGGGGWTFSSRMGVIQEFNAVGARIAYHGRIYDCPLTEIRKKGDKSALTEAFEKMGS
jgi:hypothetical protein